MANRSWREGNITIQDDTDRGPGVFWANVKTFGGVTRARSSATREAVKDVKTGRSADEVRNATTDDALKRKKYDPSFQPSVLAIEASPEAGTTIQQKVGRVTVSVTARKLR